MDAGAGLSAAGSLRAEIDAIGPWFHNMELDGEWTAPDHFLGNYPGFKFEGFADALPDVRGKSVLDIGCNAGFYALEMKKRGAARVLGIDEADQYLVQARFAAGRLGFTEVEFAKMSVYDVGALGERFDLVIFMGVLYHLRHPLLALDLIREHVAGDWLLFQTMQRGSDELIDIPGDHPFHVPGSFDPPPIFDEPGYPRMHFIEHSYSGDWTNWWAPNRACSLAMLRAAGFSIENQPEPEVAICRVADVPYSGWMTPAAYPARGARAR